MILYTYDNGPLTDGWDCTWCAAPFDPDGQHVTHPGFPELAFCRKQCAVDYVDRESLRESSQPDQIGMAL